MLTGGNYYESHSLSTCFLIKTHNLITLASEFQARGGNFRNLTDSIDTSTPTGRFFFHVMSALAEMERKLIVERTRAGLAAAREQERVGSRRRVMTE